MSGDESARTPEDGAVLRAFRKNLMGSPAGHSTAFPGCKWHVPPRTWRQRRRARKTLPKPCLICVDVQWFKAACGCQCHDWATGVHLDGGCCYASVPPRTRDATDGPR